MVSRVQQTIHIFDRQIKGRLELQWKVFVLLQDSRYKKIKKHYLLQC